jgi:GT2 family glycosyltransferase
MRIVVGIATKGRPNTLRDTLADLTCQTREPDRIVVAYGAPEDIGDASSRFPDVQFLLGPPDLTAQRNRILNTVIQDDIILFIDDDFYLRATYIEIMENVFTANPLVIGTTGTVLADGINGPGLTYSDAKAVLDKAPLYKSPEQLFPVFNSYGCNMAFRLAPIRNNELRFDERLPLYGWFEDVEFSRQVAQYGEIVRVRGAFGVHLGTKSGRQSGVRLGYSQVANPIYLAKKGTFRWGDASIRIAKRCLANLVRSIHPELYVDRRGRLRGNLLAFWEIVTGALSPMRILQL